jgi:hypothetical protein
MKAIPILAAFLLIDFIALNVWAIATGGFGGLLDWFLSAHNNLHYVVAVDLVLALSICPGFMWYDARRHGDNPIMETYHGDRADLVRQRRTATFYRATGRGMRVMVDQSQPRGPMCLLYM